jgi:DNA polymerase I-like protein with 3'-5' exonuclease and polymerase domains
MERNGVPIDTEIFSPLVGNWSGLRDAMVPKIDARYGVYVKTATRDKYKVMLLSVQYGMATRSLAVRMGVSDIEAHELLAQHRAVCSQYWAWSKDWVQHAFQSGAMRTAFGWHCRTGITELNDRSVSNWPIQSTGADILRIACILAVRHGIKLCAPVHDAALIEAPIDRIEADVTLMQDIMRRASRIVLNDTAAGAIELRTDAKIIKYPDRYTDKRGDKIWSDVMELLAAVVGEEEGLGSVVNE